MTGKVATPYEIQLLLADLPPDQRHALWREAHSRAKRNWRFWAGAAVTVGCLFAADRLVLRHVRYTFIVDLVVIGVAAYVGTFIGERLWLRVAIRYLQGRLTEMGRCAGCGYNLTGNTSGVCPECGIVVPAEANHDPLAVHPRGPAVDLPMKLHLKRRLFTVGLCPRAGVWWEPRRC
jgi:hypothetical protein